MHARRSLPAELVGPLVGIGVALVVLAPLARPGLALSYDMVFVPDQPLVPAILGLDGVVPRAVPSDLVVALLSRLVGVGMAQRVILLGVFAIGAWGVGRLVSSWGRWAAAAAALFFVWNAYTFERLALGQWALLVGMAALPWAVKAADEVRNGAPARRTIVPLGVAALGAPAGGVLVLAVTVLVSAWGVRDRAQLLRSTRVAALGLVLSLWWLVPSLLRDGPIPADENGVSVFASRADTRLGTFGSLLTLGGTWNGETAPAGRESWAVVPVLLAILATVVYGVVLMVRAKWPLTHPLLAVAGLGLALALAATTPGLQPLMGWLVVHVPGGGLLRDAQKWIAPLVLLESVAFGAFVGWAASSVSGRGPAAAGASSQRPIRRPLAVLALLLPVIAIPGLAWGLSGRLTPTAYPDDYARARQVVADDPADAAVLALPWSAYRRPSWTATPMLGSIPRWMPQRVVADDRLVVGDVTLPGEDPYALRVQPVIESGDSGDLAALGIGWVVLEKDAGGPAPRFELLEGAKPVLDGAALTLFRLPAAAEPLHFGPSAVPVIAGDVAAGLTLLVGLGTGVVSDRRPARRSPPEGQDAPGAR